MTRVFFLSFFHFFYFDRNHHLAIKPPFYWRLLSFYSSGSTISYYSGQVVNLNGPASVCPPVKYSNSLKVNELQARYEGVVHIFQ